jgi:hypothetical protein
MHIKKIRANPGTRREGKDENEEEREVGEEEKF